MIIKTVSIKRFGKLKDYELNFKDGLNIIYGENEAGKSTIQNFIRAMFYGMSSQKKNISENIRKKYLPWEGERAAGKLLFIDDQNNEFIIERSFGQVKKQDICNVYNNINGERAANIDTSCPGKDIFGINEETFEKTMFIKQLGAQFARDKDDEIMGKLLNIGQSGDENISFHKAVELLENIKKNINGGRKKGKIEELREKIYELNSKKVQALSDNEKNLSLLEEIKKLNGQIQERRDRIKKLNEDIALGKKLYVYYEYNEILRQHSQKAQLMKEVEELKKTLYKNSFEDIEYDIAGLKEANSILKEREKNYAYVSEKLKAIEEKAEVLAKEKEAFECLQKLGPNVEEKVNELLDNKKTLEEKQKNKAAVKDNSRNNYIYKFIMLLSAVATLLINAVVLINSMDKKIMILSVISLMIFLALVIKSFKSSKSRSTPEQDDESEFSIDKIDKYLYYLLTTCGCRDINEFTMKMKEFKAFRSREQLIQNELKLYLEDRDEHYRQIRNVKEDITLMINNFNIPPYVSEYEALDFIQNDYNNIKKKSEEYKEIDYAITNALRGRNIDTISQEMERVAAELPEDILKNEKYKNNLRYMNRDKLEADLNTLSSELIEFEKKKQKLKYMLEAEYSSLSLGAIEEEIISNKYKLNKLEEIYKSADIANQVIVEAFNELQMNFGPKLNNSVSDIMSKITGSIYSEIKVTENFEMNVYDNGQQWLKSAEYLSGGTYDQVYFALRLALVDIAFDKVKAPIILDDTFIQLDEQRLANTITYLKELGSCRQVILFTCRKVDGITTVLN